MPEAGLEPTITAKTVHAFDRSVTITGLITNTHDNI
jgi:hypothetical protein